MPGGSLTLLVFFFVVMLKLESRVQAHVGFVMFVCMLGAGFCDMAMVAALVGVVLEDV